MQAPNKSELLCVKVPPRATRQYDAELLELYLLGAARWNQGIKTMKKGENAVFTIPSELAYGESGSPPTIPPNAILQFDAELLSWTSVKDIFKDGGIFKKILTEGEKGENPKDPDEVLVKYEAGLEDGTLVAKSDGVEFTVKEGHFCPALSKAGKTMKPQNGFGETGKLRQGDEGAVPPNASLEITLELVSWETVPEVTNDKKVLKKILEEGKDMSVQMRELL
ncbi:hypothetical protein L6164_003165 [Bauhinia variegata]|uniref:Uncharacterized protein n=1 Tax=Bauhinia variegata TaxID=167791 RepID=A0ACB9Q5Z7_BAUVA|nr:hypothetical protein L6164_003165 [Bauhinia variegata]